MTERFDRGTNGQKLHVHSLCGLLGFDYNDVGAYSYEQALITMKKMKLSALMLTFQ